MTSRAPSTAEISISSGTPRATGGPLERTALRETSGAAVASRVLAFAAALIFAGHGLIAFGVNEKWLTFFHVVGMSSEQGRFWMPLIGAWDLVLALVVLVRPVRAVLIWMTLWALWTAMLRPLSGASILEFIERGGNFGVPFALLVLRGWPRSARDLFR